MTPDTKAYWDSVPPPMGFRDKKWTYEERRAFRYELQDYMPSVFPFKQMRGKSVLEVGCGSGIDLAEFARNGAMVTGVDFSPKNVALTQATLLEAGCADNSMVLEADATKLPFPDASFDCLFSFGVLHHVPDIDKALAEIARVLRPGGLFTGMVYNRDSLLYAYSILTRGVREGLTPDEAMRKWSERVEGCPYSKAYTFDEWHHVLRRHNIAPTLLKSAFLVVDLPNERKVKLSDVDLYGMGWHIVFNGFRPS